MELVLKLAAVLAVVALAAALRLALSRGAVLPRKSDAGRALAVVERVPLSPHQSLHLVRFNNRMLLIACWPNGCALLQAEPAPPAGLPPVEAEEVL